MNNKFDIFISYRREGGYDTAKHLNDLLVRDGYRVSFDVDTLRSGDFDTQLYERIDQCKDFIVIVDPHAFDRTLDPKTNPQEDWMRCELAYALRKKKNVIPVFLAGANGFPKGLPEDVVGVVKKNGPEYNRYHFNAFYADLKKRFLKSRTLKPYLIGLGMFSIVACIVGMAMWMLYLSKQAEGPIVNDTTEQVSKLPYPEIETTIPWSEAKSIVKDVLVRNPIMAVGYKDGKEKIVALFNISVFGKFETAPETFANDPQLQVVVLSKEAGVWSIETKKNINMQKFDDLSADCYIFNDSCSILHTEDQYYLYFSCEFSESAAWDAVGVWHDYVALNIVDGSYTHVSYFVYPNTYSANGELRKEDSYPEGIERYLLSKLEADNEAVKIGTDVADKERMYRDWLADNPQCRNHPEKLYYGERHKLVVKMYDNSPDRDGCDTTTIGHYIIYNSYKKCLGNIFGYDKNTKKYFPIWIDETIYNPKKVEAVENNVIRLYGLMDISDDTVDAVVYNLDEHSYYYEYYIDPKLSN